MWLWLIDMGRDAHRVTSMRHFAGCTTLLASHATVRATRAVGRLCCSGAHSLPGTSTRLIGAALTRPPDEPPTPPPSARCIGQACVYTGLPHPDSSDLAVADHLAVTGEQTTADEGRGRHWDAPPPEPCQNRNHAPL